MTGNGLQAQGQVAQSVLAQMPYPQWLNLLPAEYLYWRKQFAAFTAEFTGANVLGANANLTIQTQIDTSASFCALVCCTTVTSTDNTTLYTYRPITLQINDNKSQKNLFQNPVRLDNIAPPALAPFFWGFPYVFDGGTAINTTLANLVATAFNVQVAYIGFKLYPVPQ
jgi:hypothetical protein